MSQLMETADKLARKAAKVEMSIDAALAQTQSIAEDIAKLAALSIEEVREAAAIADPDAMANALFAQQNAKTLSMRTVYSAIAPLVEAKMSMCEVRSSFELRADG